MNIVEIAAGSDDFNLLVQALTAADLVTTVQNATDITVFAPTDAAFTQLAVNLGFDGDTTDEDAVFAAIVSALTALADDDDPIPLLTDILLYHVSGGAQSQSDVNAAGSIATLLDGATITPTSGALQDGEPDLADPMIVIPDIQADNGVIQAIDNVLLPIDIAGNTSITDIVAQSGSGFDDNSSDFDMLLAAVSAAGLAGTLDDAAADLTVFAPNDGAFIATAQALGFQGDDEEGAFGYIVQALTLLSKGADPIPLLTSILTYHVSPGAQDSTAVLGSDMIETLQGGLLSVDGAKLVDADPDLPDPTIIATDIPASNGIVHVLDGVLLPVDILPSDGSKGVGFVIAGEDPLHVNLGDDNDFASGSDGDDTVTGGLGDDVFLGNGGTDTAVFENDFNNYLIQVMDEGVMVQDRGELASTSTGMDFLKDVELLQFGDNASFVSEDRVDLSVIEGAAGLSGAQFVSLVELYVAYFNRAPDALGVLFWANALNNGVSLREIAELFFDQTETHEAMAGLEDTGDFVDMGYNHVLERDADARGKAFWVEAIDSGGVSKAEFLLELIAGARANDAAADDVRTIEDKTDIGVSYALVNGLTNVENAMTVMEAYVRENAAESLGEAQGLIENFALLASGAADGPEAVVQIIGAVDDPFMVA